MGRIDGQQVRCSFGPSTMFPCPNTRAGKAGLPGDDSFLSK